MRLTAVFVSMWECRVGCSVVREARKRREREGGLYSLETNSRIPRMCVRVEVYGEGVVLRGV